MARILKWVILRLRRRRLRIRARRKYFELKSVSNKTGSLKKDDIFLFTTVRNERTRLPYFLEYYRKLGVNHFFVVDNDSDDGTSAILMEQSDCSVWHTSASYKKARFGMDWINGLMIRYAVKHWSLVVDVDEFFVYPHCDTRPLRALTDWLDASAVKSFPAMLLDMYSDKKLEETICRENENPFEQLTHFDAGNYIYRRDNRYGNLWIQGGPRMRTHFADKPRRAPALNKIPLVRWQRGAVYVSSTHSLLPRGFNRVYDEWGGEKPSGILLHAKFMNLITEKAEEELARRQHYARSREYQAYREHARAGGKFWTEASEQYRDWRQLEQLGLMSSGGWI